MKSKYYALALIGAAMLTTVAAVNRPKTGGLVVHEWGTFTSFQAADGVPLTWRPLLTADLPGFVYNWSHPGLNRMNYNMVISKGSVSSLQRMETPVVYFYSDHALTADLSVGFPRGLITEWYPQAAEVGPSFISDTTNQAFSASKSGSDSPIVPDFDGHAFLSPSKPGPITNSLIHWSNIDIMPAGFDESRSPLLANSNGNHYFTARETDANVLRLDSLSTSNSRFQHEKFLFYRGTGNFSTPLRVTMALDDAVTLSNTGDEPLAHLFLTDVQGVTGGFIYVPRLAPGESKTVRRTAARDLMPTDKMSGRLAGKMSQALVKEGLFAREAAAMVNPWKDSWFTENGTRVFYILPRAWTDRTLPMTLNPAPRQLVRVMVGRAELLTPGLEQNLVDQLQKFQQGDSAAGVRAQASIKGFGRFAEPAFSHALARIKIPANEQNKLASLLYANSIAAIKNNVGKFE